MEVVRTMIRLPKEHYEYLKAEAEKNHTSRNAEIIRSVRERMEAEQAKKQ